MESCDLPIAYRTSLRDQPVRRLFVRASAGDPTRGWLTIDGRSSPVTLGRSGIRANKREGDGATPRGIFFPIRLWWRADRHVRPYTRLPIRRIRPVDGWCEDPNHRHYNRPVHIDHQGGDRLTRDDDLYDFIIEIDHNMQPRVTGRGSAVFLHLARESFSPTAGCVGMKRSAMLRLLARIDTQTRIVIG